jgi:7,8-dihydropterin-6-yl-methyl-4-(beta-D-ribofuranosyl)aminobenzene 5'-phosphate synthase
VSQGILNIIAAVRKTFPKFFIEGVFGGFHLDGLSFEAENATKTKLFIAMIGQQMLTSPILRIYTGHCTGVGPYGILKGALGSKLEYLSTGSKFYVF